MDIHANLTINPKLAYELTKGILDLFAKYGDPAAKPERAEIEKFFEPHIQISSNERIVCRNSKELVDRFLNIQKKYRQINYSKPLEDLIISGNKIVLRYNVNLIDRKEVNSRFYSSAILTVEHDKVLHWTEIVHKQNSGSWDI